MHVHTCPAAMAAGRNSDLPLCCVTSAEEAEDSRFYVRYRVAGTGTVGFMLGVWS